MICNCCVLIFSEFGLLRLIYLVLLAGLLRRFAPRNDVSCGHATALLFNVQYARMWHYTTRTAYVQGLNVKIKSYNKLL